MRSGYRILWTDHVEVNQRGMVARRILDGIVRNVYISNTGKTAAWTSASHIKQTPKKSTTTA